MSLHIHMPKLWSSWQACNLQELIHWWNFPKTKAMFNVSKSVRMRHQRQRLKFALCSTGKYRKHSLNLWTFFSFPFQGTHSINSLSSRFETSWWEDVLSTRKGFKDCIEIPSTLLSYMSHACLQQIWYGWKCRHRIAHLQGFAMLSLDEVLELSRKSQTVMVQVEYLIAIPWEIRFQ